MKIKLAKQMHNNAYLLCNYCEHTTSNMLLADGITDWEECSEQKFEEIKKMVNFHNTHDYYKSGYYYTIIILLEQGSNQKSTIESFMESSRKRFEKELERQKQIEERLKKNEEARKLRKKEQDRKRFEALKKKLEGDTN